MPLLGGCRYSEVILYSKCQSGVHLTAVCQRLPLLGGAPLGGLPVLLLLQSLLFCNLYSNNTARLLSSLRDVRDNITNASQLLNRLIAFNSSHLFAP